ncbi:MAG: F0F1 ATP synthase subunit epsilon [bacterium]|nr:F0F1 ATP synthase subunit epsilon [bacterium]
MHIAIHSIKGTIFEGEAKSLNCKTASGEITILDHHRPFITILQNKPVKLVDVSGEEKYFPVASGFLEVQSGNAVRLIVEQPEKN